MSRRALHPTVLLLAATHFMVDGYGNIYAPLLPLLIPRHGMDLRTAGTLAMLFQIAASVSQLAFGHVADRWRPRLLLRDRAGRRRPGPQLDRPGADPCRCSG